MSVILGPDGRPLPPMPLVKAGIDSALATGSLPDGAVAQSDLSAIVDDLWVRISKKVRKQGVTARDVNRTIAQVRRK